MEKIKCETKKSNDPSQNDIQNHIQSMINNIMSEDELSFIYDQSNKNTFNELFFNDESTTSGSPNEVTENKNKNLNILQNNLLKNQITDINLQKRSSQLVKTSNMNNSFFNNKINSNCYSNLNGNSNNLLNLNSPNDIQQQSNFSNINILNNTNPKFYQGQSLLNVNQRNFNFPSVNMNLTNNAQIQVMNSQIPIANSQINSMLNQQRNLNYNYIQMNQFQPKLADTIFLNKIIPNLINLIKTKQGSKLLQDYLNNVSSPQIISAIFNEISQNISLLFLDPSAKYFCLKLFSHLNQNERIIFLNLLSKDIIMLSSSKISTYPIQCLFSQLKTDEEKMILVQIINKNIPQLSLDIYGTHVLEKMLNCLEYKYCSQIIFFVLNNYVNLSKHVNGLCLAKQILILEYKNIYMERLKSILNQNCLSLIENPYSNYIFQIILDYWEPKDYFPIISQIRNKCTQYSMMKFSSNVIEKCIEKSELFLGFFIEETCLIKNSIGSLIKHSFGNYVVQTALKYAKGQNKKFIISSIESNLNILGERKLITKWKNILTFYKASGDLISN